LACHAFLIIVEVIKNSGANMSQLMHNKMGTDKRHLLSFFCVKKAG
jgi:hypothetical protein